MLLKENNICKHCKIWLKIIPFCYAQASYQVPEIFNYIVQKD